jgi:hypothetical protein
VVGILEVFSEHDVTVVQKSRELRDGEVPHAPRVLILVGDASVEDEAPPGCCGFVDSAEGLDEEGNGATLGNHLNNTLPSPGCYFGPEGNLGSLVALPAGVVGPARVSKW